MTPKEVLRDSNAVVLPIKYTPDFCGQTSMDY